jgi:hypothetical protein
MVDQETIVRAEFPVIVFESTRKAVDEGRYASAPQGEVELQALRQVLTSPPAAAELDESPIFGIAELDESQLDESPQDQMRRFEWIRHFVRLNELQKAYDLGWDGKAFQPRLMLPLSLTWDHRVIDGAAAARFNAFLGQILADFRRVLL